jgi:signal peptidase I
MSMTDQIPTPETPPVAEKPDSLVELIKTIVYAVLLALCIRSVAFEPFNIPSGSMLPNLLVGDYLFVSKYSYGYSRYSFPMGIAPIEGRWWPGGEAGGPIRGTIVVFKLPSNNRTDYIKRVIGMPGDRIQMISGRLYINGEKVEREYVDTYNATGAYGEPQVLKRYVETLPGGIRHDILELSDEQMLDNTPVFVVPSGHYFMMGDNRDNSQDSRVMQMVGFVPAANILGPARWRFFSIDDDFSIYQPWTWPGGIRWGRMFGSVHE